MVLRQQRLGDCKKLAIDLVGIGPIKVAGRADQRPSQDEGEQTHTQTQYDLLNVLCYEAWFADSGHA